MARTCAAGAVLAGCLLGVAAPASADDAVLFTFLTGSQAIPPGDPDGFGFAVLVVDDEANRVCAAVFVHGIEPATAAHIHFGAAGTIGGHAVDLDQPPTSGFVFTCGTGSEQTIDRLSTEPQLFYLNVHNEPHPAGALRGQLGFS